MAFPPRLKCAFTLLRNDMFTARKLNLTEIQFANTRVYINGHIYRIYVLRTNRALTVLVLLLPINTKYSRDADAFHQ